MKVAVAVVTIVSLVLCAPAAAEHASQPSSSAASQLDAGRLHTCAIVAGGVHCWGLGFTGQLGYGNTRNVGDDETPGSVGAVDLGSGHHATAIAAGDFHTCALLDDGSVRCWGFGADGRLGYRNLDNVGDDETPGSVGPVQLGAGRTATAITAGGAHTCALLDDASVRCWGFGQDGRLGYGNQDSIGDDETPDSVGPVDLGTGRTAAAVSAGRAHTCAILDDGAVRCWGSSGQLFGGDGRLGYPELNDRPPVGPAPLNVGDNETPGSIGPVDLGPGRTATAIAAGDFHTCTVLDDRNVRCWGLGESGQLGYGNTQRIGDNETPGSAGPVDLGSGRTATAISAGSHSCARLDDGTVRCWGFGANGRLGYGATETIGDEELPGSAGPVNLGAGRTAAALSAGGSHTCARVDGVGVRCWGEGTFGQLGYRSSGDVGDDEPPAAAGPVDLKPLVSIGDGAVREGASGERTVAFRVRLSAPSRQVAAVGYATADGGARAPGDYDAARGTLAFQPGATTGTISVRVEGDTAHESDERFAVNLSGGTNVTVADGVGTGTILDDDPAGPPDEASAIAAQASRLRGLRRCRSRAERHVRRELRRSRALSPARRAEARRHARRHARRLRRACLKRFGRTPGRVLGLTGRATSSTQIVVSFRAAGTDGSRPPVARAYLVRQAARGARRFGRATTLCGGSCRFPAGGRVGAEVSLAVTGLRPRTVYRYSVAARDNVSRRAGPRSVVAVRTR